MPQYRRSKLEGGTFFFTLVTYNRLPILTGDTARELLHEAWLNVCARYPFETLAVCLLPDHLHCIWRLPEGDSDYPVRWKEIKRWFTRMYLLKIGPGMERNESRQKRKEVAIWQRRFWEHTIRDEQDLLAHMDYIHYNPVKHGYVKEPVDWKWSSFLSYARKDMREIDWRKSDAERGNPAGRE